MELPLHLRDEHGEKLDRSKNDFYVTASLMELGFSNAQIMMAFTIFRDNGFAAGMKFKDKGNTYLTGYTIPAAKEKVPYNIYELIQTIETCDSPAQALELGERALKIVQNTRAEDFVVKIHEVLKIATGMDKKSFADFTEGILSGGGAYVFESYRYGKGCSPNHKKLAEAVIVDNPYIRIGSELYRYAEGYYTLDENQAELCAHIWAISENRPVGSIIGMEYIKLSARTWVALKQRDIQEIVAYVRQNARPVNLADEVICPDLICVKNGMLDWKTKQVVKHDPKYLRLNQLSADYVPEAKSVRLEKFIDETFHKQDIDCIWEYMGVTIAPDITAKNFMIYVGSGDNGKSVWLNTVRNVLGNDNISSASLEDLAENRFTKSVLIGKVANIAADISGRGLEDISSIKELTGNDQTSADRKFQSQVTFVNRASLMFSCNILPEAHTADDAYFRRLMITDCPNQVAIEDQDKLLEKKLCTEEAKSAWLNLALAGLKRFHNKGRAFTESTVMIDILNEHKKDCRPDIAFVDQYLIEEPGEFITLDGIIQSLKSWAHSYGELVVPSRGTIKSLIVKKFPKQRPVMRERGMPGYQDLAVDEMQMLEDLNIPEKFSVKVK
jgi:P4 family phage/plasmid primase-like protien